VPASWYYWHPNLRSERKMVKLNVANCKHNMKRTFYRRVAAALTCFVNDIFCCTIQPGPDSARLGRTTSWLGAKRVLACAVVRLLLFKLAAPRQLRFRALLYLRKKIPPVVQVNTAIAKTRVFNGFRT
jgi:hypothetical protein